MAADNPNAQIPTFSERLFSEEVAIAQAKSGESLNPNPPGYEFSNGTKFSGGYDSGSA